MRQHELVKSEALQDKRLIHYLQQEVATLKAIADVKVKDLGYIANTESGVVHKPVVWAKDVVPMLWRTACGWAFGFSQYEVSSVSPVGAVFCRGCSGKGTKQYLAEKHRATLRILSWRRLVFNLTCPTHGRLCLTAELWGAIGCDASTQQQ